MSPRPQVILKPRYYLDHFEEMVEFVQEHYRHAFEETHEKFLSDFAKLGLDSRCLYVRFANRKGRIFFREYLRYEEIEDMAGAVEELRASGFIRRPEPEDFVDLLALQTRPNLVDLIRENTSSGQFPRLSSAKKRDLVTFGKEELSFETCFPEEKHDQYLVQDRYDEIDYLLFLYFGKSRDGLTTFALRDLGVVKPAEFRSTFEARFETKECALASYHYHQTLSLLKRPDPNQLLTFCEEARDWPEACDMETENLRGRALRKLGRELERQGRPEQALEIYRMTDQFPATERAARILVQLDRRDQASTLLERMIDNPSSDEELLFAEDFYARKFKSQKVGRLTSMLREATVLHLDESGRGAPEAAAARAFEKRGIGACHVENLIWQQLFGLAFWDLLFGETSAPLHNSFEIRPAGLDSSAFYERNTTAIEERLQLFDTPEEANRYLRETWKKNEGTPNGLLPWYPDVFARVQQLVALSPQNAVRTILSELVRNHRENRSGFPDLMLVDKNEIRFVEIKAEGDQLQRHQLAQLERLRRVGYQVEVMRVAWTVDPEQEYVVVDVETTGGNPQWNRVTEIGAVKVKGGRIIEEWSTLLNPGRRIPKMIVELTGITDEMVADAPPFSAIAEEFREFLGHAVFVAHRAKFDHGFLRAEFQRIEQDLKCPTLCTVVATRRYFPGLPSYGLAKLCAHFEIPLESHHRALCDARATAHILIRINEERLKESAQTGPK